VTLRQRLARTLAGTLIFLAALISVGLAAPADGLFSIEIKPVFLRLDAAALAESRASALGLDVNIRIWTLRLHFAWSAVPMAALTRGLTEAQEIRSRSDRYLSRDCWPPDLRFKTTHAEARPESSARRRACPSSTKPGNRLL